MRRQALLTMAAVAQVQALGLRAAGSFWNDLFVRAAVTMTQVGLGLTLIASQEQWDDLYLKEKDSD